MTIKNIVFDVGNVLVRWDPAHIVSTAFPDHDDHAVLAQSIFRHQTWLDLNLGHITEAEALARYSARLGIEIAVLERMADIVRESLIPVPGSFELLKKLHAADFRLYALTDNTVDIMAYLRKRYDFWPLFLGVVVSAEVGHLKPSREIYDHLLGTYALKGAETVFIDDMPANVEGAKAAGINAIQFQNTEQCVADLRRYLDLPE